MIKVKLLIKNRNILKNLVINDFKSRYIGSYLGVLWGFVQPLITVIVYWFVFSVGFRSGSRPDGIPYIIWLIVGIIPWFYYTDVVNIGTGCYLEYSYLVKKISFQVTIIPIIKLFSSTLTHLFFIIFIMLTSIFYGISISFFWFQAIYYFFAMFLLCTGIVLFTSSINVFFRDISQIIAVFLQIGFWLIPIVWSPESIPYNIIMIFKLNPMYYIVEGYRDSFINQIFFWEKPLLTLYFWIVTLFFLVLGKYTNSRLKNSFADVL